MPEASGLILVGGGVRSGKSGFALQRAKQLGERRAFVATAQVGDAEMHARVRRHRAERGDSFVTVEEPFELAGALRAMRDVDVVLIDCLTLWLSNRLLQEENEDVLRRDVAALAEVLRALPVPCVVVTNEVGMGVVPPSKLGRLFRDLAGLAHQRLAAEADEIYLAALGSVLRLRPGPVEMVPSHPATGTPPPPPREPR